jgi:hypothetical protein
MEISPLKHLPGASVLVASFTGYLSREVALSSINGVLKIALVPDVKALDEVAVIGYQSRQKALVTGAVSSLDGQKRSAKLR